MNEEIWKLIKGFDGYQISNYGRVRNVNTGKILKPQTRPDGYISIYIGKRGSQKNRKLHRIIAEAFIPNPNNYPEVNHKNEDKSDNRIENLEWCTREYNMSYGKYSLYKVPLVDSSIKVIQYDMNWNFVRHYNSIREAARKTGFSKSAIQKCINKELQTVGCFIWRKVLL